MAERMQNMTPEQREQMMARRGRGGDRRQPSAAGADRRPARARRARLRQRRPRGRGSATTIDALFGPLPHVETRGQVWVLRRQAARAGAPAARDQRRADDRADRRRPRARNRARHQHHHRTEAVRPSLDSAASRRSWVPVAAAAIVAAALAETAAAAPAEAAIAAAAADASATQFTIWNCKSTQL